MLMNIVCFCISFGQYRTNSLLGNIVSLTYRISNVHFVKIVRDTFSTVPAVGIQFMECVPIFMEHLLRWKEEKTTMW